MRVDVTNAHIRRRAWMQCFACIGLLFITLACAKHDDVVRLTIISDLEKLTEHQDDFKPSPTYWDAQAQSITLAGAGNEVVACQVVLNHDAGPLNQLDWQIGALSGPQLLPAESIQLYRAHYLPAGRNGSYSWGPKGGAGALPWMNRSWPDALVPLRDPYCTTGTVPVAAPFDYDPRLRRNEVLWVDLFIPAGTRAGEYHTSLTLTQAGKPLRALPLRLTVRPFDLPSSNSLDAFGELYRETGLMYDTGVKFRDDPAHEWPIYARYVQLAHAHRIVAAHRAGNGPLPSQPDGQPAVKADDAWSTAATGWPMYSPYVGSILNGDLFTSAQHYLGPNAGAGPAFYPSPFIEQFFGARMLREILKRNGGKLPPEYLARLRQQAAAFRAETTRQGWSRVRWFAYIFDEVVGGQDTGAAAGRAASTEVTQFHQAMRDVQAALDAGAGEPGFVRLLWTSHGDAAQWRGTPADLTPFTSWWCPSGESVNVKFFTPLAAQPGQTVWFYHAGQPMLGNHSINQTGIDLLTWPLLAERYRLDGFFIWSLMNFSTRFDDPAADPYSTPNYNPQDTRLGNGVMLYPGSRLKQAGYLNNIAGPVASLRLKALRRGLQDAEYIELARRRNVPDVDAQLKQLIPRGFSEAPAPGQPGAWNHDPRAYEQYRVDLAQRIAAGK